MPRISFNPQFSFPLFSLLTQRNFFSGIVWGLLLFSLFLSTGCDSSSVPQASQPTAAPPIATTSPVDLTPVPKRISLRTIDREEFDKIVAEHKGKVVLVDFWATWCPPCVKQFSHTIQLHNQHAEEGLVVISVSMDDLEEEESVRAFLEEKQATFTNLLSKHGSSDSIDLFGIDNGALPNYWIYNRAGEQVKRFSFSDPKQSTKLEDLDLLLKELLAEEKNP